MVHKGRKRGSSLTQTVIKEEKGNEPARVGEKTGNSRTDGARDPGEKAGKIGTGGPGMYR